MSVSKFLKEIGRPVAYYPRLANAIGSVKATVFLCQLLYWQDKGHNAEGWIYKKQDEIEQETGLTRRKQESARKILVELCLIEEARKGTHGTLHFRINLEALDSLWSQHASANGVNAHRPMAESANDECTNAPNANGATRHTLIKDSETTAETTTKNKNSPRTERARVICNQEGLNAQEYVGRLLDFRKAELHVKTLPSQGKEASAAKYLFDEQWSIAQVKDCYHDLKKQKWRGTPLDLMTVRTHIADWKNGSLNLENGNGQPKQSYGKQPITRDFSIFPDPTG